MISPLLPGPLVFGFLVFAAAGGGDDLAEPAPAVPLRPAVLAQAGDHACAACHGEVVEEWSRTAHGLAWVDEAYRKALRRRRRSALCHACHIPQPLLLEGQPAARARAREEALEPLHFGVSCATCHAGPGGVQLGARGAPTEAHASAASPFLAERSSELCAVCHSTDIGPVIGVAKGFGASDSHRRGESCVGCHMARVERPAAPSDGGEDGASRPGRSHLLQTPRDPAFARRAFGLSLRPGEPPHLILSNQAGHRVPGLIRRVFRFRVEARDGTGALLTTLSRVVDVDAFLPAGASLEIELPRATRSVRILGDHEDPRAKEPVRFLEEDLVL